MQIIGLLHRLLKSWTMVVVLAVVLSAIVAFVVTTAGVSPRWQWWTESPNDLAPVACIGVIFSCGIMAWVHLLFPKLCGWKLMAAEAGGLSLGIFCVILLLGTCSRGGILAIISALSVALVVTSGLKRRIVALFLLCIAISAFLVPRVNSRITAISIDEESIDCRISLVDASLKMIGDRPSGLGDDPFDSICERWYLDKYRGVNLWHPLNDALWLGTRWGIAALAAYYVFLLSVVVGLLPRVRDDLCAFTISLAVLCFLISGTTTCLLRPDGIPWIACGLGALALFTLLINYWKCPSTMRWGALGAILGSLLALAVLTAGHYRSSLLAYRPVLMSLYPEAEPRNHRAVCRVAVIRQDSDQKDEVSRQIVRSVAAHGYTTTCMTSLEFSSWEHRGEPHVIFALRGVSPWPLIQRSTVAALSLDPDRQSTLELQTDVPIILVYGSREIRLSSIEFDELGKKTPRIHIVGVDIPRCWSRQFYLIQDQVLTLIDDALRK